MIQNTTLQAWMNIDHILGERQSAVHVALEHLRTGTNHDLATFLGWPINSVTPRVLELRQLGLVACTSNNPHLISIPDCLCHVIQNGRRAIAWHVIKKRW